MKVDLAAHRFLARRLPSSETRRIVVLTGPRQVGKTTLARRSYPALRYVNLDEPESREAIRAVATRDLPRLVGPAVLDEAQKEPSLFDKVKFAFDDGGLPFAVLLGSARFLLLDHVKETLAGRTFIFELFPLLAAEIVTALGREPRPPLFDRILDALATGQPIDDALASEPAVLLPDDEEPARLAIAHLERWGGMPELLRLSDGDRREWLRSYQQTFLERDLPDLGRIDDVIPFRKLERLAMARTGQLLDYASLARDAGLSATTARRYLGYLQLAHQTLFLQPFSRNITSTVVKTPKIYWADLGLLFRGETPPEAQRGAAFETLVTTEAHKWVATAGRDVELSFYRTRSGMEVDLLVSTLDGLVGIEAKARDRVDRADLRGLRALAEGAGPSWRGGICVYRGRALERLDEGANLWAVPVHRLFT